MITENTQNVFIFAFVDNKDLFTYNLIRIDVIYVKDVMNDENQQNVTPAISGSMFFFLFLFYSHKKPF